MQKSQNQLKVLDATTFQPDVKIIKSRVSFIFLNHPAIFISLICPLNYFRQHVRTIKRLFFLVKIVLFVSHYFSGRETDQQKTPSRGPRTTILFKNTSQPPPREKSIDNLISPRSRGMQAYASLKYYLNST